jgi:hypothetical protein
LQGSDNGLQDALRVLEDFVIPESQNAPALLLQKGVAHDVSAVAEMLAAIALHCDTLFEACEVENVGID